MLNVIRYFPTAAFMFGFLELYKKTFPLKENATKAQFLYHKMLLGGMAGSSSMIIIFPLDFLRTRISVEVTA